MVSKVTFSDIRIVSESLQRKKDNVFIDYLNSFEGKDIYEKFINILVMWETDVSYTLNFNINNNPTKIQLSYIISQFQEFSDDITIETDNIKLIIGVPNKFELTDGLPIYGILKYIDISGIFINLSDLSFHDRKNVIDNLPASIYNIIIHNISLVKDKTFGVDNLLLQHFKINFLSNDPLVFMRGLFESFDDRYFREIIYYLSRRIDTNMLLTSTPQDIEYYLDKMSKESEQESVAGINL